MGRFVRHLAGFKVHAPLIPVERLEVVLTPSPDIAKTS